MKIAQLLTKYDIAQEYELAEKASSDMMNKPEGSGFWYEANSFQVFCAARIYKSLADKSNVYLSMAPGQGKTFVIHIVVQMLRNDDPDANIIVTTHSDNLLKQLDSAGKQFGNVVNYWDLDLLKNASEDAIIVCDEWYHSIRTSKVQVSDKGEILGAHGIANFGKQRILLGGSYEPQLGQVGEKLLGDCAYLHEEKSIDHLLGRGSQLDVVVDC